MEWVGFSLQRWNCSVYPNAVRVGFFLKWKLVILHISSISRCRDSQADVGMKKLIVVLQESLISYVVFGRVFDLPPTLLKSKKEVTPKLSLTGPSGNRHLSEKCGETHKNIQIRSKMAQPLFSWTGKLRTSFRTALPRLADFAHVWCPCSTLQPTNLKVTLTQNPLKTRVSFKIKKKKGVREEISFQTF